MSGSNSSNPIIGIDLGTSTSEIAFLRDGRPEIIQDAQGDRIIPSVVQVSPEGQIVVGTQAKRGAIAFADCTVEETKRLMGTDRRVSLGETSYSPEEIAAILLRYLKETGEARFGAGSIRDVVISVPARFDNPAREATRRAAEMAGLNVLRLINEPTAAALSYGLDRLNDEKKVLVFDFGGGTLDVTVLELIEGILDVKTSLGDDQLGGKDIDELLVSFLRDEFRRQRGSDLDPDDKKSKQFLKQFAEDTKKNLSSTLSVTIDIPYLSPAGGISSLAFSRASFEKMVEPLVERAMKLVDDALARAKMTYADIDVILPVGGSSRIPVFRREIERRWGKTLQEYDNPDEAIARGAAIAAGIAQKEFDDDGIMILDVSPHRLGVAARHTIAEGQYIDDFFSELVPKDAQLPAVGTDTFLTIWEDQEAVQIRVFEATTPGNLCADHRPIAQLEMTPLPPGPAGQPFQVEFRYSLDGTLDVTAWCLNDKNVKIAGSYDVVGKKSQERTKQDKAAIDRLWQNSDDVKRCMPLLDQAEHVCMERPELASRVRVAADDLRSALAANESSRIERYHEILTDILYDIS